MTAKGLHLWKVKFGFTQYWITTRLKAPQTAIKRAQLVVKEVGEKGNFYSCEYAGTIDA